MENFKETKTKIYLKEYGKNKNREKIKVDKQNKKEKVKEKNLVNYSFV